MGPKQNWLVAILTGAWSIVKGLAVTLRNAGRPRVTQDYPHHRSEINPRWRGRLQHLRDIGRHFRAPGV